MCDIITVMQSNNHHMLSWLHKRGITDEVIALFNISIYEHPVIGECIKIPFTDTHSKYRRDPLDERKPKYLYDAGGKVTLFGADKIGYQQVIYTLPGDERIVCKDPSKPINTVVITEGELDALVLWSMNIPAVSSTGGAMSFQPEWVDTLQAMCHKNIYLCFDNDDAGAEGMVRVLRYLPNAKVIFIPETPGVKDISDFVSRGGDFHALMATAQSYPNITAVEADKALRKAQWLPTRFHDKYLDAHRQQAERANRPTPDRKDISDEVLRAKAYPLDNLIEFRQKKACCPWHNEKTASLVYYPKTNSADCFGGCGRSYDSIDAYRLKYGVGFKQAVEELNKLV